MQSHVIEREGERRSRPAHRSKATGLVSATVGKQQETRLCRCHTSKRQSFDASNHTFIILLTDSTDSVETALFC